MALLTYAAIGAEALVPFPKWGRAVRHHLRPA